MDDKSDHGANSQSIKITKRSDRSIRMLMLQKFLFVFKTYLASAKKHYPPESVRLKPPTAVLRKCTVKERQVDGIWIYDLEAKKTAPKQNMPRVDTSEHGPTGKFPNAQRKRRIYYFAGGGWQMPASKPHWKTLAEILRRLSESPSSEKPTQPAAQTVISVVSFPLAPASPAPITFPKLVKLYETLVRTSIDAGEYIIFAGDSAGGNLACALVIHALSSTRPEPEDAPMPRQEDKETEATPSTTSTTTNTSLAPHAILALCPSVHLCRDNNCPILKSIEKKDPLLSIHFITCTADHWVGAQQSAGRRLRADAPAEQMAAQPPSELPEPWDKTDPRVSPLKGDIGALARAGVRVHGTTAGYDLLSGDARRFRDRCNEEGVQGKWLEWERQMHCWHLTWSFGLPEAKEAIDWMVDVLRQEGA
ncbi:MAG: hypothetical protein M1821_002298 [Bathelium mastoideum]|nr:MAG: hypothetical protein M1821_002298 [Bathelium mastoideum]